MMDVVGCTGMELRSRHNSKRKRFDDEECLPAKRPLTEETMSAIMHQLKLNNTTSSPSPHHLPTTVSITAVTTCPSSSSSSAAAEASCCAKEPLMRGASSALRDSGTSGTSSVHIRVTPATPPSSELPSQEEEPMEQSGPTHRAESGVVLEDLSSSDSSDSEMPSRVWIAPELLRATHRHLLSQPFLSEIARSEMAVVPWVSREERFNRVLALSQERARVEDLSSSSSDEEAEEKITD